MYKILFVCTGNICRSPTAEGVLRHKLEAAGLADKVTVASAGTHGYHIGEAPDSRSIKIAAEKGYAIHEQRAQKFHNKHYDEYDLILAMDEGHLRTISRNNVKSEIALFCEYAGLGRKDVPDPYYGDIKGFRDVLDLIEKSADNIISKIGRKP